MPPKPPTPPFPHRGRCRSTTPVTRAAGWLFMSTALVAAAVSPPPAFAAADTPVLLAGMTPVADRDLASLRGGFMTKDGLLISFGFQIDLGFDDQLGLALEFDPLPELFGDDGHERAAHKPGRKQPGARTHGGRKHGSWSPGHQKPGPWDRPKHGGPKHGGSQQGPQAAGPQVTGPAAMLPGKVKLTLKDLTRDAAPPLAELGLGHDGSVEVLSGTPEVTQIAGGQRYDFGDDLVADVVETAGGGVTVETAHRNVPVQVARTADGVGLEVGDEAGTRIVDRITPKLISSQLTNRRDGADVDHTMNFDINLLNFNELSAGRKTMQSGRRMERMVSRELVRMMALPR